MRIVPGRSSLTLLAAAGAATVALAAPGIASAQDVIVRFKPGVAATERADARAAADVAAAETLPVSGMEVVDPAPGTSVAEAVADLERSPDVLYAEPVRRRTASRTTTDPQAAREWGLDKISAPLAWDTTIGDRAVTVGVIDSGVDAAHPDLAPNIWTNAGEIAGNGLDDDHDNYVDDVHGWDFVDRDADPNDLFGHGTHVAGTIAANGDDGIGVTGVAWQAGIVPLRALGADGGGYNTDLIEAYAYAETKGIRIVNLSLGGPGYDPAEYDAIRAAKDVLFVVAAGNEKSDNETAPSYPCAYDLPNIVCVAATNRTDGLASFSNWGAKSVDLAAPGTSVLSTYPRSLVSTDDGFADGYETMSGTSMATPHVAGAAALVAAHDPGLTPWQLGQVLLGSVDPVAGLAGRVVTGGRLDAAAALGSRPPAAIAEPVPAAPPTPTPVVVSDPVPTPTTPDPTAPTTATTPADTTPATGPSATVPAAGATSPAPVAAPPSAPTPTPVAAADRAAPKIALTPSTRLALRTLLAGRLKLPTAVSEKASLRIELRVDRRTAKRLHLGTGRAAVTIASGTAKAGRAGTTWVRVRLTSRAKRALSRLRSVKATIRATGADAAGNRRTTSRTVTLAR